MAFRPPQFNLNVNLWLGINPVANPPTLAFRAVLSPGRRVLLSPPPSNTVGTYNSLSTFGDVVELLCPKGTDIRGCQNNGASTLVEVPAGTGRYYLVLWVDDVGKGFPNEYRLALLKQCDWNMVGQVPFLTTFGVVPPWPVPTP